MATLHFFYGTMGSGKSGRIIDTAYSLNHTDKKAIVIKPAFDNRDSVTDVVSRSGRSVSASPLQSLNGWTPDADVQFVLVDEVQFFKPSDIDILVRIADAKNVIVMCYGLMVDCNEQLFPASKRLVEVGAKLHQMETTCQINGCMHLATHHLHYDGAGNVIRAGESMTVGDSEYKSVCRKHFYRYYYNINNIRGR